VSVESRRTNENQAAAPAAAAPAQVFDIGPQLPGCYDMYKLHALPPSFDSSPAFISPF
jgi:hypothetical protein